MSKEYAAFLSYSTRYTEWVAILQENLERCLAKHGEARKVFLDQTDLGPGQSWITQLQQGLDRAERLVLVVTPETLASPRVEDEWGAFIAEHRDWKRRVQLVMLLDTPLPPFLKPVQWVDFDGCDADGYRAKLRELLGGLLGHTDRRELPDLSGEIEIPAAPADRVPRQERRTLVGWLGKVLEPSISRFAVVGALQIQPGELEGHPSWECAASAVLVEETGDDDRVVGARRLVEKLGDVFRDDPAHAGTLEELSKALAEVGTAGSEEGLLGLWLRRVEQDHSSLLPYFDQHTEIPLLEQVYVQLQLRHESRRAVLAEAEGPRLGERLTLPEVLELRREEHPWITGRWVVLGDPGAGKTTLLRHLAAQVAGRSPDRGGSAEWVPVFDSLPRLMREREWLFDRIERLLSRAGQKAKGLPAMLEGAGRDGRLLLLLDGLDEVPKEDRGDIEGTLRDFSTRWPKSPIVVTSRPIGYRRPAHDFRELELLPFDGERRREFLARWFGRARGDQARERADEVASTLERDTSLRDLAGNPLYLTLMALLIEKGTSPDRHRTGLYDQVFRLLLDGGHRPDVDPIDAQDDVRRVLRHLAHEMTRDNRDSEPVTSLESRLYQPEADALREPLERVRRWRQSLRPFLDDLAERTGILGPHDGPAADWRYWHRTFREALAAEALADKLETDGGETALLADARQIAGEDLSRWAEAYALLTGRVKDPDRLVKALVEANRELGLRALATAQNLRDETLREILELSDERGKWEERSKVYERIPELVDDPPRALALLDQLRKRTRNGNDLFFLERAVLAVGEKWPDAQGAAERQVERLFDHIPPPPEDLFRFIETQLDGRVELWRKIPAGRFLMGSLETEKGRDDDEGPQHEVVVASGFQMGAVPVTVEQYAAFDPEHVSYFHDRVPEEELRRHPADSVTWYQAHAFCRWLASLPGCEGARLPTEEEWEYACRAVTTTRYWSGDEEKDLARVGWYDKNSKGRTHPVGEKPANPWHLYDVHGNVREWTLSEWDSKAYQGREGGITIDPAAPVGAVSLGGERVIRGGSYGNAAAWARSALRLGGLPGDVFWTLGFRVLLPRP